MLKQDKEYLCTSLFQHYTPVDPHLSISHRKKGLKLHRCNLANLGLCKNGKPIPLASSDWSQPRKSHSIGMVTSTSERKAHTEVKIWSGKVEKKGWRRFPSTFCGRHLKIIEKSTLTFHVMACPEGFQVPKPPSTLWEWSISCCRDIKGRNPLIWT